MIKKFSIENFKVFNERTDFELAPITLLTGPNNSGKSSLTKGIAAMLNSHQEDIFRGIDLFSPVIPLGDLTQIKNFRNTDNNIKINICLSESKAFEFCFHFGPGDQYRNFNELDLYAEMHKLEIIYKKKNLIFIENTVGSFVYTLIINFENILHYFRKNKCQDADKLFKLIQKYGVDIDFPHYSFERTKTRNHLSSLTDDVINYLKRHDKSRLDKKLFSQFIEKQKSQITHKKDYDEIIRLMEALYRKTLAIALKSFEDIRYNSNSLRYFPINRGAMKATFQYNSAETLIERTINFLIKTSEYNFRRAPKENIFDDTTHMFNKKWLDYFSIGKEIIIEKLNAPNYNIVIKGYHKEKISINNIGQGVGGLITLIIGLRELFEGFCVIEEPESNLHPAFQSKLADLFAEVYKNIHSHLLIETHSEYLIRKFQYLVAQKELKPEDIIIYYFHDPNKIPEGEKHIKKISIREDGRLSEPFGTGFFDETDKLLNGLISGNKIYNI